MNAQQAAIYFAQNPDVAQAYSAAGEGMSPEQFASAHYAQFGWSEQRKLPDDPNAPPPRAGYNPDGSQRTSANPNNVAPAVQVTNSDGTSGLISGAQAAADADPGAAYRAQREQAATAALAPQRAMEAWQAQIDAQPWAKDFARLAPAFGAGNWGYDSRTGKFTNHVNALIDQYGTYDPREYAAKIGIAPPAEWQSDPSKWQRDTSPEPTRSPYQQDIADRQAANAAAASTPLSQRRPATPVTQPSTPVALPAMQQPQPSAPEVAPASPKPLISAARLPATNPTASSSTTSPGVVSGAIGPSNPATVAPARSFEMPRQPQSKVSTSRNGLVGGWMRG